MTLNILCSCGSFTSALKVVWILVISLLSTSLSRWHLLLETRESVMCCSEVQLSTLHLKIFAVGCQISDTWCASFSLGHNFCNKRKRRCRIISESDTESGTSRCIQVHLINSDIYTAMATKVVKMGTFWSFCLIFCVEIHSCICYFFCFVLLMFC